MNSYRHKLFLLLILCSTIPEVVVAQKDYKQRKNILKVNLTSLFFRNYQFQAERVLTKTISVGFTYANIPLGDIPFRDQIINQIDPDDVELTNILTTASIGYTSLIPEIRFYLGKGYGKGMFLAPFYKYSKYTVQDADIVEYERDDGTFEPLTTSGTITANTFGLLLGFQFNLGSGIVLDWWLLGPNIGTHKGSLSSSPVTPFTPNEQQMLSQQLEDIEIPLSDTTFTIGQDNVKMENKGNWLGVRSGLSVGIRF